MKSNSPENRPQVQHVAIGEQEAGMRLDNYLMRHFKKVPKSHVYRIVRSGQVRVNKKRAKAGTRINLGDVIRIPPVRQRQSNQKPKPPDGLKAKVQSCILEETNDWLVFNKPAGLAVHGGSGLMFGLIETLRAMRPGQYLELVHRLDRQTSGCLVVAKNRHCLNELQDILRQRQAVKTYWALVAGQWPASATHVNLPLRRDVERGGERVVIVDRAQGRAAQSDFKLLERFKAASLVEVKIITGRTHQIRVHAASLGHPIVADQKYGGHDAAKYWRNFGLKRMFLHACGLFMPLAKGSLSCQAPLPADLVAPLAKLRGE